MVLDFEKYSFKSEIQSILSIFGDKHKSFDDTLCLLNIIVAEELDFIISNIGHKNNYQHILKLFNYNFVRIQRFIKWMDDKNLFMAAKYAYGSDFIQKAKSKKISVEECWNYLKELSIDPEVIDKIKAYSLPDPELVARHERLNFISNNISPAQYILQKKQKIEGFIKNKHKLKEYIMASATTTSTNKIEVDDHLLDIIGYLLKETIISIVDLIYLNHSNKTQTTIESHENPIVPPMEIPNLYVVGITIHDINAAIGHLYTTLDIEQLRQAFPKVPYFFLNNGRDYNQKTFLLLSELNYKK